MIRIGHIDYANCTPIFTALRNSFDCSRYEFIKGVPAQLNSMLVRGEIDLCPSSSIVYGRQSERFLLLPDLSISSIGPVKSVLLFSRVPIERLDGEPIALTAESETSVNLIRIILSRKFGFTNSFERLSVPVTEALTKFPACLLIGDAALKKGMEHEGLFVYDLGALWLELTGLPFVFALWLVTREAADRKREEIQELSWRLVKAKEIAYGAYETIARGCREREWIGDALLVDYWRTISYDLTERHLAGVKTFYAYAAGMGLLEREPEINLLVPG